MLLLLAAMSCWLTIVLVWYASGHDVVWLGTDGLGPLDTAQYLA